MNLRLLKGISAYFPRRKASRILPLRLHGMKLLGKIMKTKTCNEFRIELNFQPLPIDGGSFHHSTHAGRRESKTTN